MALREDFEREGNWLFRRRSYLPILMFGVALIAMKDFSYPRGSHRLGLAWETVCVCLALAGLGIRIATVGYAPVGTSGGNTSGQMASSLNTTGLYSIVRHPLYLGNYLMWMGLAAFPRVWWVPVLTTLVFWLYYERIMFAEEEFLRRTFGEPYTQWAASTPTFVPRLSLWKAPEHTFSVRVAIAREYSGVFAFVSCFTILEVFGGWIVTGHIRVDPIGAGILVVTLLVYLTVLALKRRTHLLDAGPSHPV